MFGIYYVKAGRKVRDSHTFQTETAAKLYARERAYYDGKIWKVEER